MSDRLPQKVDGDAPIFVISVAAQLASMHPQTLRTYDRLGLVVPKRARGRGRRYSYNDVHRLRLVQYLSQEEGINLPGIRRILELEAELQKTMQTVVELREELAVARAAAARSGQPRVFRVGAEGDVRLTRIIELPPSGD